MNFFKKKSSAPPDLSWLVADMHSHLLPGIDDGSRSLDDSLEMIRGLVDLGYRKLITTPHILWDLYKNTPEKIQSALATVLPAIQQQGLEVELRAAAEYFIDDHMAREVREKSSLLTLSGNLVLVEFSMMTAPMELNEVIFELQMQNYQPVLAHPERYTYLGRKKEVYDELKDAGCYFQLNLLSLSGYYGAQAQELADYLMKKNYYDLAGTDMHHVKHLEALKKIPAASLKRLQDSGNIKNRTL
ncbi:MAG: tyrosine-protein phosphatase [Flavisolibacter sp.]